MTQQRQNFVAKVKLVSKLTFFCHQKCHFLLSGILQKYKGGLNYKSFQSLVNYSRYRDIGQLHGHLRNIDCLTARTACLVCFISTVKGCSKKERKEAYYNWRQQRAHKKLKQSILLRCLWLVTMLCLLFWSGGMPVVLACPCVTSLIAHPRMMSFFV